MEDHTVHYSARMVLNEVDRQVELWGQQDHPVISALQAPGLGEQFARDSARDRAAYWQEENARRVELGDLSWDGILLEEVYEALAEKHVGPQIIELAQVAAVVISMMSSLLRNNGVTLADCVSAEEKAYRAKLVAAQEKLGPAIAEGFRLAVEQGHERAMSALGFQPESRTGWEWIEEGERLSAASEGPHPAVLVTLAGM
jgi:hypothetical protein